MHPTLVTGEGVGRRFVSGAAEALADAVGFRPFHGTLNLEGGGLDGVPERTLDEVGDAVCDGVGIRDCRIHGVRAAVLRPFVPDYPPGKTEVLAPVRLRGLFDLDVGDPVPLRPPDDLWPPADRTAVPGELSAFDAVVFDLDGTLVDLAADWAAARDDIRSAIGGRLDRPLEDYDAPDLYRAAREADVYDELVDILGAHERAGAEMATPLPPLTALEGLPCPVGICTANAPEAAARALDTVGARNAVDVIVGRGTVPGHKPSPEPLLACLDALSVRPGNAVFVGDSETDALAAARAGTSFLGPAQVAAG